MEKSIFYFLMKKLNTEMILAGSGHTVGFGVNLLRSLIDTPELRYGGLWVPERVLKGV